jgi:hypothetical protein
VVNMAADLCVTEQLFCVLIKGDVYEDPMYQVVQDLLYELAGNI